MKIITIIIIIPARIKTMNRWCCVPSTALSSPHELSLHRPKPISWLLWYHPVLQMRKLRPRDLSHLPRILQERKNRARYGGPSHAFHHGANCLGRQRGRGSAGGPSCLLPLDTSPVQLDMPTDLQKQHKQTSCTCSHLVSVAYPWHGDNSYYLYSATGCWAASEIKCLC